LQTSTNGSVDAPRLDPAASAEAILDVTLEYTSPASDPIAVEFAFKAARERQAGSPADAGRGARADRSDD
jgi:hypothetical protein